MVDREGAGDPVAVGVAEHVDLAQAQGPDNGEHIRRVVVQGPTLER